VTKTEMHAGRHRAEQIGGSWTGAPAPA